MHCLYLNLFGKRRRESVKIVFYGIAAFGLQKELVMVTFGKAHNLVLNGGTISWSHTLYASLEHRRLLKTRLQNIVHCLVRIGNPTTALLR